MTFTHEKLEAYQSAIRFLAMVHARFAAKGKSQHELIDQVQRAALSIVLNIAEGAGEFSPKEKRRFYRMALRSGNECAAAIHAGGIIGIVDAEGRAEMNEELGRAVAMLTRLAMK